jgi:5-(carboxyamino)imidazole ribonucleotide synthase
MLAMAAARLGVDAHIYTPEADSPASRVAAQTVLAPWEDEAALTRFAADVDVITFEFENIPVETLTYLAGIGASLAPGPKSLSLTQDRLIEKTFVRDIGLDTVPFAPVSCLSDLPSAVEHLGGQAILKRRRFGYDGRGQSRIAGTHDAARAWAAIGAGADETVDCIVEGLAGFQLEVSALVCRTRAGHMQAWDVPHNIHAGGILDRSLVPAPLASAVSQRARTIGFDVAEALGHVGVLAVELFVMPDGRLIVNEIAPRVHNSGHWTPEACLTGQFEQHVRAVLDLPLGATTRLFDAEMHNLVGDTVPPLADLLQPSETAAKQTHSDTGQAIVTMYGKRGARPGRKMGHVVVLRPYDA